MHLPTQNITISESLALFWPLSDNGECLWSGDLDKKKKKNNPFSIFSSTEQSIMRLAVLLLTAAAALMIAGMAKTDFWVVDLGPSKVCDLGLFKYKCNDGESGSSKLCVCVCVCV